MKIRKRATNTEHCMAGSVELPLLERWICYITWTVAALYSSYCVYVVSHERRRELSNDLFENPWRFTTRDKDTSNFEWEFWTAWFGEIWPYLAAHILIGQLLRWIGFEYRQWVFCIFGMLTMWGLLGPLALLYFVILCLVTYLAAMTGSLVLVWAVSLSALSMLNFGSLTQILRLLVKDDPQQDHYYLVMFTAAMFNIRYTSFCTEWCQSGKDPSSGLRFSLIDMFSYTFYIPTLFTGPIMTYDQFYLQLHAPLKPWTWRDLRAVLGSIAWMIFWAGMCELTLHHLYFNALMAHPEVLETLPLWAVAGVGYSQGQFFMVKYLVMFGLPRNLARLDQLDPPTGPKCISRIYLYSEMWKFFDRGLYSFIKRHIYIPLGGSQHGLARQLLSSLAAFSFILYWHGPEDYLAAWVALNYVGITIETLGTRMDALPAVRYHLYRRVSPAFVRRVKGVLAIPLLAVSSAAIFTFFGGIPVGSVIARRLIFEGWPVSTLTLAVVLYCMIQTSLDVRQWEVKCKRD